MQIIKFLMSPNEFKSLDFSPYFRFYYKLSIKTFSLYEPLHFQCKVVQFSILISYSHLFKSMNIIDTLIIKN